MTSEKNNILEFNQYMKSDKMSYIIYADIEEEEALMTLNQDAFKSINYWKVRDHCLCKGKYRGTAHSICNLKFNVSNEFPVAFHDSSNYDYHFIIKELANKFEGKFECLRENTKKYKTLSFRSCKMFFSSWISTSSSFKKKTEVKLKLICHNA